MAKHRGSARVRHGEACGSFDVLWGGGPGCARNRPMRRSSGAYAVLAAVVRCVRPHPTVFVDHEIRPGRPPGGAVGRFKRRQPAVSAPGVTGVRPFGQCVYGRLSDPRLRRVRSAGARIGETSSIAGCTTLLWRLSDRLEDPCPITVRPRASDTTIVRSWVTKRRHSGHRRCSPDHSPIRPSLATRNVSDRRSILGP